MAQRNTLQEATDLVQSVSDAEQCAWDQLEAASAGIYPTQNVNLVRDNQRLTRILYNAKRRLARREYKDTLKEIDREFH